MPRREGPKPTWPRIVRHKGNFYRINDPLGGEQFNLGAEAQHVENPDVIFSRKVPMKNFGARGIGPP